MEDLIASRTIVVGVMATVFAGFVLFLFFTERKISRLEKEFKEKKES